MLWRAGQASMLAAVADNLVDVSSLRSSICQPQQPSLTAPTLQPPSALFGLRPMTDSPALPPLHSTRRQAVVGRAGLSLSSVGDEPAQGDAHPAERVALLQRPGRL